MTGGRLGRVAEYVKDEEAFCFTYGDGVGDIDITASIDFHRKHGKWATLTAATRLVDSVRWIFRRRQVMNFKEKPKGDGAMINGGFFVLSPKVLSHIKGDQTIWEQEPLMKLAEDGQLMAYEHHGFWQPMDTLRDKHLLEELWVDGKAPWKKWDSSIQSVNPDFWRGKRVFLTGHTGFKGSWLSLWLRSHGRRVAVASALMPHPRHPHSSMKLGSVLVWKIRSATFVELTRRCLKRCRLCKPDIIIHMAAQPLVRYSYQAPVGTYATNVIGHGSCSGGSSTSWHVQGHRQRRDGPGATNKEWVWGYR
jgi:hypothetical protein